MNFHESADRDFSIQFCEYNYSNPDYDQIYRPNGSGDYLFLLFKTPMKVYLDKKLSISKENACILYAPGYEQHYKAVHRFRNSYLHFSCKADLKKQYGIPLNTVFYPGNCEEIDACIRLLHKEHIANDLFSDEYEYTLFQHFESFGWKCSRTTLSHGTPQSFVKRSAWKKASSIPAIRNFSRVPLMQICFRFVWIRQRTC